MSSIRIARIKKSAVKSVGKDVENSGPSYTLLVGM